MEFVTPDKLAQYMDVSSYSAGLVSSVCGWVNDHIPAYCRRSFDLATYRLWQEAEGESSLFLPTYPVVSVTEVSVGTTPALSLRCGVVGAVRASVSVDTPNLTLSTVVTGSGRSTVTLALSDYDSMGALADGIMDEAPGWIATALVEVECLALKPCLVSSALSGVVLEGPGRPLQIQTIGREYGVLVLYTPVSGPVYLHFDAGYATVPGPLEGIAVEMAATILRASENDASLASESLGDYRIQRLDAAAVLRQFYPRLDHWRLIEV